MVPHTRCRFGPSHRTHASIQRRYLAPSRSALALHTATTLSPRTRSCASLLTCSRLPVAAFT